METRGTIKVVLYALFSISLLFSTLPDAVFSETVLAPAEDMGQISVDRSILWAPGRLAVGLDGTLYVVDGYKDHILKFDSKGNYRGDIKVAGVSAVAGAADGTLYIGSHRDYSVAIYNNGTVNGYLGSGAGEFFSIRDIAVDQGTGNVFVADNVGNAVKIYDSSGRELGMIEGVHLPIGIHITGDEIYILDAPIIEDPETGSTTTDSVISVFDKGFNLIRTIDENEVDTQMMFRPTDMTVSNGSIYISDAAQKAVLVYDANGTYLGEITGGMNTAVSLALSPPKGILYVSSSETHSIQKFALNTGTADGNDVNTEAAAEANSGGSGN